MNEKNGFRRFIENYGSMLIAALVLICALVVFGLWGFNKQGLSVQGAVFAAAAITLFALGLALAVPKATAFFKGASEERTEVFGERSGRPGRLHPVVVVMLLTLAARLVLFIAAYMISLIGRGYNGTVFSEMESIWLKSDTDAPRFFNIAQNWYSSELPQGYDTVYLPLFPLLIRLFDLVFRSSFVSAMVINTLCTCAASAVIYELALPDMGRRSAKRAVLFAFAMPAAIFFAAPVSEALFLVLTASALLALRKEHFWLAGIFGALASFTRLAGIMLVVPFIAEAAAYAVRSYGRKGREGFAGIIVKLSLSFVILLLGTFAYLLINRLVWGDWFKFIELEREQWGVKPALFLDSAVSQIDNLFSSIGKENQAALGVWLPGVLHILGALLVFVLSARTLRTSYTLYFAAYFAAACGSTVLVSAPRYLAALVVLPLALAHLCESRDDGSGLYRARAKTTAVTAVLIVGQAFYLLMYVMRYGVC